MNLSMAIDFVFDRVNKNSSKEKAEQVFVKACTKYNLSADQMKDLLNKMKEFGIKI